MMPRTTRFSKPTGRIGRAPVDTVDALLTTIGIEIQNLCIDLANLPADQRQAKMNELTALTLRQSDLRFKRGEIINKFFNGGRA